jgi:hypothetical protein
MKRNVASQFIGAQMVSATDGSAFTSSVTVHVTGDGGTQATGSVGSGACTHEGNGFHTYAPAQAETDSAHVAFTFTGTGAVPATVQVYPSFPQTGDAFAALTVDTYAEPGTGAPAATATIEAKIGLLYKFARNKIDNDGTTIQVYADDAKTVDHEAAVSESGGVVTRGEFGAP